MSRIYTQRNVAGLEAVIERELGAMKGNIKVAFIEAQRDGVARKDLIARMVKADRDEMRRLREVAKEIKEARVNLAAAERAQAKAARRWQRTARRKVREARETLIKAKAKKRTAKTFFARFETSIEGKTRDAIRREAERAVADVGGSELTAMTQVQLAEAIAKLADIESRVSRSRRQVQSVVDLLTEEIARRYQTGELGVAAR